MMLSSWWRTLVMRRVARAARTGRAHLRAEALESRDTPAGVFASAVAAGSPPVVTVFDAVTRQQQLTINAFDGSFSGGVNVAVGDVNGDGTADVIAGAGPGGGPEVQVFSGTDGTLLKTFTVGGDTSRAGVSVAAADFDGDGRVEVVAGGVLNGQPIVQVLRFSDGTALQTFTPFAGAQAVSVAAGDVNGDGTPDVVAGAGTGGGPTAVVFDGKTGAIVFNQLAFEDSFRGGAEVAAADLDGDGAADVLVAAGPTGGPRVVAFSGKTGAPIQSFFTDDDALRTGTRAVGFDADADGRLDVVATTAAGLQAFDIRTLGVLTGGPTGPGLPVAAVYDTTAPTATVTSSAPDTVDTSPIPFTVTFTEAVNGFSASGLTVTNGTVSQFTATDARTYAVQVTPTASGAVSVTVAAGAASDAAGNTNPASAALTRTFSGSAPTVTIAPLVTNDTTPTLSGS